MQILKKLFLIKMSSQSHKHSYDTHHGVVINRAKFDAFICSSFRGVKTDRQNLALHIRFILIISINQKKLRKIGL